MSMVMMMMMMRVENDGSGVLEQAMEDRKIKDREQRINGKTRTGRGRIGNDG